MKKNNVGKKSNISQPQQFDMETSTYWERELHVYAAE